MGIPFKQRQNKPGCSTELLTLNLFNILTQGFATGQLLWVPKFLSQFNKKLKILK